MTSIGPATESERHMIAYLANNIENYLEQNPTATANDLIASLFFMLYKLLEHQPQIPLEKRLSEIDNFCFYLKEKLMGVVYE